MSKLIFKQIGLTCPETYLIIDSESDLTVATMSLRYGKLRVWKCGKLIYEASVGDEWTGRFTDYEEKMKHFEAIEKKILEMMEV